MLADGVWQDMCHLKVIHRGGGLCGCLVNGNDGVIRHLFLLKLRVVRLYAGDHCFLLPQDHSFLVALDDMKSPDMDFFFQNKAALDDEGLFHHRKTVEDVSVPPMAVPGRCQITQLLPIAPAVTAALVKTDGIDGDGDDLSPSMVPPCRPGRRSLTTGRLRPSSQTETVRLPNPPKAWRHQASCGGHVVGAIGEASKQGEQMNPARKHTLRTQRHPHEVRLR